ncbi:hypothetical protein BWQ96_04092 [Gracilariopsis chorda]|uniref:Uncharacterized protein n=1 Tax=Gracilariopsis chorda TaxID=448386 RepID=A0A2V3IVB6_9FLOR|nr:hypothetical protein BWQ96_04092 [Gracilariopsis chorda]|eukprot:PXF46086.1 hypothetical protein BWQ96_04092 [Gracilariopsis chorda]
MEPKKPITKTTIRPHLQTTPVDFPITHVKGVSVLVVPKVDREFGVKSELMLVRAFQMSQQKEATVDGQQSFSLSKRSFKRIDIRLLAWEEFVMLIRSGGSLDDIVTVNTKNKSDLYVKMKICGGLFILYLATKVGML